MPTLVPSDIYPALRRFLLAANLPGTLKAFQNELGWHGDDPGVRLGLPKCLKALDLIASCQLWVSSQQSASAPGHVAAAPERRLGNRESTTSGDAATSAMKKSSKWSDPVNLLGNLLKKTVVEDTKGVKRKTVDDVSRAPAVDGATAESVEEQHPQKRKKANRKERQARQQAAENTTTVESSAGAVEEPAPSLRKSKVPAAASTATSKEETPCESGAAAADRSSLQTGRGRGMGQGKGDGRGRGQGLAEATAKATAEAKAKAEAAKKPRDLLQVFVGGLPFTVDEAALRKEFSKCGAISKLNMPLHEFTGTSKGIAFITYEDEEGMLAAMKYNGEEFKGRVLKVNRGGAFTPAVHKIFVKGLPYETTEDALKKHFGDCGEIENARMPKDDEGNYKGYAFITYTDKGSCQKALEFNQTDYLGRWISVKMA